MRAFIRAPSRRFGPKIALLIRADGTAIQKSLQPLHTAADNPGVVTSAQKQASAARRARNGARGRARGYPRVTNPVKAGLVKRSRLWTGFNTVGWRFGETRTFKRPKGWFFDEKGDMPAKVSLTLVRPPIFPELDDEAPKSFEERFKIAPKVAASSPWLVLAQLQRNREWERQYARRERCGWRANRRSFRQGRIG